MGKLGDRLRSLFGRKKPPSDQQPPPTEQVPTGTLAEMLRNRVRRVSESFLDNERLTADLDDLAAKALLDWGLKLGSRIAQGTADVEDDEQADEAMYPRLRATRRMMRDVNLWITSAQQGDREGSGEALNQIIEQAQVIYGQTFTPPSDEQRTRFMQAQSEFLDNPPRLIANLRDLFTDTDDA